MSSLWELPQPPRKEVPGRNKEDGRELSWAVTCVSHQHHFPFWEMFFHLEPNTQPTKSSVGAEKDFSRLTQRLKTFTCSESCRGRCSNKQASKARQRPMSPRPFLPPYLAAKCPFLLPNKWSCPSQAAHGWAYTHLGGTGACLVQEKPSPLPATGSAWAWLTQTGKVAGSFMTNGTLDPPVWNLHTSGLPLNWANKCLTRYCWGSLRLLLLFDAQITQLIHTQDPGNKGSNARGTKTTRGAQDGSCSPGKRAARPDENEPEASRE